MERAREEATSLKRAAAAKPEGDRFRDHRALNSVTKRGEAMSQAGMLGDRLLDGRVEMKESERG
jgi:hypothetical protein